MLNWPQGRRLLRPARSFSHPVSRHQSASCVWRARQRNGSSLSLAASTPPQSRISDSGYLEVYSRRRASDPSYSRGGRSCLVHGTTETSTSAATPTSADTPIQFHCVGYRHFCLIHSTRHFVTLLLALQEQVLHAALENVLCKGHPRMWTSPGS